MCVFRGSTVSPQRFESGRPREPLVLPLLQFQLHARLRNLLEIHKCALELFRRAGFYYSCIIYCCKACMENVQIGCSGKHNTTQLVLCYVVVLFFFCKIFVCHLSDIWKIQQKVSFKLLLGLWCLNHSTTLMVQCWHLNICAKEVDKNHSLSLFWPDYITQSFWPSLDNTKWSRTHGLFFFLNFLECASLFLLWVLPKLLLVLLVLFCH